MKSASQKSRAGFTLVELLLVLAIIVIVSALAIPFVQSFQVSTDLYTHTSVVTNTLRRARQQSIAGQNNSGWGVYFNNDNHQVVFFKGNTYATRDQDYDLNISYPEVFSMGTDFSDEMSFSLYSGQPSASGTVQILSPNNETKSVLINSYGRIEVSN